MISIKKNIKIGKRFYDNSSCKIKFVTDGKRGSIKKLLVTMTSPASNFLSTSYSTTNNPEIP
jgi:hypothetical protein